MDLDLIKNLIELMVTNDLSRVELREGDTRILLRRGQPILAPPVLAAPPAAAPVTTSGGVHAGPAVAVEHEITIRSPMVGTFYAAPDPDSPPFVSIGSVVTPDTVVCLIEAMKVFNELKAECAGRITKVLVRNAQAVEFDQPLFAVAPA
ncbi:MAG: acetyl-CoA carboxylase biotin carboxyl carrier protein [Planctomycetota bacterium]